MPQVRIEQQHELPQHPEEALAICLANRSLAPELLMMSRAGYVQLMDFKYGARCERGVTDLRDYVGIEHYLPPAQVDAAMQLRASGRSTKRELGSL